MYEIKNQKRLNSFRGKFGSWQDTDFNRSKANRKNDPYKDENDERQAVGSSSKQEVANRGNFADSRLETLN